MLQRQQRGETDALEGMASRYPQWRQELEKVLERTRVCGSEASARAGRGETHFAGFRLLDQLGAGVEGQVYLALQRELGDRPVVLKIVPPTDDEYLSLARLQHTHIVPLYGVYEDRHSGRRALCMPYFGNATLQHICDALAEVPCGRRQGADIVAVLDRQLSRVEIALHRERPARSFLKDASYVDAVVWMALRLADALAYAHDHDLVHLDIKPSNVLVTADGQPMLLDFHIARAPIRVGDPPPRWLGGTPAYMAPEQRQAIDDLLAARPSARGVDGRSDIYALGGMLYQVLSGVLWSAPARRVPLCRANPNVSTGLSDIIEKCLAEAPEQRYATAEALADDLRRQLEHRPLRGVANRSLHERWHKWRRRQPLALPVLLLAGAALTATSAEAIMLSRDAGERHRRAVQALFLGQQEMRQSRPAEAAQALEQGLELCQGLAHDEALAQSLSRHAALARCAHQAQELHRLVESLRGHYLLEPLPARTLMVLEVGCRGFWKERQALLDPLVRLEPKLEQQIRTDFLDLTICWADLLVRLAAPTQVAARQREALDKLAEAERLFGAPVALLAARRDHAEALGDAELARRAELQAARVTRRTAWDHYAVARSSLRAQEHDSALKELQASLALEPNNYWANYTLGLCYAQLGRPLEAEAAFSVCAGQSPSAPEPYLERARAAAARECWQQAKRDCDFVLQLRPNHADALLQRALVHHRLQQRAAAEGDLRLAREYGADGARVEPLLALVRGEGLVPAVAKD